jgi:catechol 2,3-dioxygenase-like lactoylglutathione lyase family enzyme
LSRGLDHIVHAARDLDAAAALYRALGFTVGARHRHPPQWGTQNHIVQFPGCFVELLAMADTARIAPHVPRHFSFGAHNRDFLASGEGLSMLVLEGRDTAAEAEAFRAAGIGDFEPFHFERMAARPDGSSVKVAFSLAFARDPRAPQVGFFTCRQHYPENFWNPEFQNHPNGVSAVLGAVLVAENPSDHAVFLSAFVGERAMLATCSGIAIKTARGEIQVMTPLAFGELFYIVPPDVTQGARLAALCFGVADPDRTAEFFRRTQWPLSPHDGRLTLGPGTCMGATLIFEPIER